ncbi:hypothetical protein LNI90_03695 [Tenacibaculum dicentrarchi]|nr:hypothetical protein [Tenacibaculum dicentrarchi]MCD8413991.1 hypothetical protein [Tenacibaculum dicentrarchi]MCD8419371.1 hypothetical protein [Tenacibaculum dicentrarchi]MCD8424383.1 hypothetical protein [Tenacibaculum dicentrarchi]MCD8436294.1 hypothetical protein [Tenacibaculum dicentrarchi]
MKKIIYLFLLTVSFTAFAQMQEKKEKIAPAKNEFKIDAFDLAFMRAFDFSYERVDNQNMGYGVSLLLNFQDDDLYYEKFAVTPFFRMYFFNKQDYGARGFFAEVYTKFASGENPEDYYEPVYDNNNYSSTYKEYYHDFFDVSFGMGLGWKWVNKNGFSVEASLGGGRYLGFDKHSPEFSGRGGVSFGYRF